jgi:hypothetical protein
MPRRHETIGGGLWLALLVAACGNPRPGVDLVVDGMSFATNNLAVTHQDQLEQLLKQGFELWETSAGELAGVTIELSSMDPLDGPCSLASQSDPPSAIHGCAHADEDVVDVVYRSECPAYSPIIHELGHMVLFRRNGNPDQQHLDPRFAVADRMRTDAAMQCRELGLVE